MCTSRAKAWELTKMKGLSPEIRSKQENVVFELFRQLISAIAYGHLKKVEMFEVVDFLKKEAPDLNFHYGFNQWLWSFMYKRSPHFLIYMYYLIQMTQKTFRIYK